MIRDSCFHRRGDTQSHVDATEVVPCHVQGHGSLEILQFLTERIDEPGEPSQVHSEIQVRPFAMARGWRIRPDGFCRDVCDPRYVAVTAFCRRPRPNRRSRNRTSNSTTANRRAPSPTLASSDCYAGSSVFLPPAWPSSGDYPPSWGAYMPTRTVGTYAPPALCAGGMLY